jgi:transcriptional regulator
MYTPNSFRQDDTDAVFGLIERHSFATLVSNVGGELTASHLPLLIDRHAGSTGQLLGHMARANSQWRALAGRDVLAVFSGPHAYVSPTWYGASPMVPTWNYLAVHVYGRFETIEENDALLDLLQLTATKYESSQPRPWTFAKDDPYVEKLLKGIIGFRVEIERIEGKWKLGQNHSVEVRRSAAEQLVMQSDVDSQAIGRLMLAALSATRSG